MSLIQLIMIYILMYARVFIHELGHVFAACKNGAFISDINVTIDGGLTSIYYFELTNEQLKEIYMAGFIAEMSLLMCLFIVINKRYYMMRFVILWVIFDVFCYFTMFDTLTSSGHKTDITLYLKLVNLNEQIMTKFLFQMGLCIAVILIIIYMIYLSYKINGFLDNWGIEKK